MVSAKDMNATQEKMNTLTADIETLKAQVKTLEETVAKMAKVIKQQKKANAKPREKKSTASGFTMPVQVSDALRGFLGLNKDDLISRVDVTKRITAYVKENSLQSKENGRIILPDAKLTDLLKPGETVVTWFSLPKLLKGHIFSAPKPAAPVA